MKIHHMFPEPRLTSSNVLTQRSKIQKILRLDLYITETVIKSSHLTS